MTTSQFLLLVVLILVNYRLAEVIAIDQISQRFRDFLAKFAGKQYSFGWYVAELFSCPFCIGIWIAAGLAFALKPNNFWDWFISWLAIAGGQAFLETIGGNHA